MKRINTYLILLTFLVLLSSADCNKNLCDKCHYHLTIKNNHFNTIYYNYSEVFPDTTVYCPTLFGKVSAGKSLEITRRDGWESTFKVHPIIQFFIVDSNIHAQATCDSISKNNLILKRIQLNLQDTQDINWIVTYP